MGGPEAQRRQRWMEVGVGPWEAGPQSHRWPVTHDKPGKDVPSPTVETPALRQRLGRA